jgi:hypothetical protein
VSSTFFAFLLVIISPIATQGVPIVFTHSGSGSGTIDGVPFSNSAFTIEAIGDTDNIVDEAPGIRTLVHDSASISIDGVGVFGFVTATRTFVNQDNGGATTGVVGFARGASPFTDLFNGPANAAFKTWDMLSSIGPVTCCRGSLLQWDSPEVITDAGVLWFSSELVDASFQAEVPEPTSLCLFASTILLTVHFAPRLARRLADVRLPSKRESRSTSGCI